MRREFEIHTEDLVPVVKFKSGMILYTTPEEVVRWHGITEPQIPLEEQGMPPSLKLIKHNVYISSTGSKDPDDAA